MRMLFLALALIVSPLLADTRITTRQAIVEAAHCTKTVVTSQTIDTINLQTEDGKPIGDVQVSEREPVVKTTEIVTSETKPVGIIYIDDDRPLSSLLIRFDCLTGKVEHDTGNRWSIATAGTHSIKAIIVGPGSPPVWYEETLTLVVDKPTPPAPPPLPPAPPGPQPPTPDGTAPIDGDGLRVAIIYESSEQPKLSKGQQETMFAAEPRAYLTANCVKETGTAEWRLIDQDTPFFDANSKWKKALARPRASIPWLLVSNGKTGFEGPLPDSWADTKAIIDRYKPAAKAMQYSAKIVMYTAPTCYKCNVFKVAEKSKLDPWIEFVEVSAPDKECPIFVISTPGKSSTINGTTTAAALNSIVKSMGAK